MQAAPGPAGTRLDLVVAGHANIDRFLFVDRLPALDRTVPLERAVSVLGGTAATVARTAARAGVRTALVSRVGPDFPEEFVAELRRDGVAVEGLERVEGASSPVCFIVEDRRGHQFTLIHQGPMGTARGAVVPETLLATSSWLHLTTGHPDYQLALQAAARRRGLRVAVDPAQELHYLWDARRLRRLVVGAEMLFGNRSEIARVLTLLGLGRPERLLELVPTVVITLGPRGAVALTRDRTVRAAAVGRPRGQVTGAGDAFRGGFYGAFFRGEPLERVLREANRAAARWMRESTKRNGPGAG